MTIEDKRVVSIHYRLTGDDGAQIDSSAGQDPLIYLHGAGNIIPGLERELAGKAIGDKLQVTIQPEDGYGPVQQELVRKIPRDSFQGVENIEPGMQFQASNSEGQTQVVTVLSVDDDGVGVDANHPLAGRVLHFDVTVEAVREATEEELAHGHVH